MSTSLKSRSGSSTTFSPYSDAAPTHSTAAPGDPDRYRADIEGLRAIAVLSVIAYHAGFAGTPGGFVGVDIFFTLSGYLITGLLYAEMRSEGRIDFLGFYARRGRRLLPAALAMLLFVLAVTVLLQAPSRVIQTARASLAASVYASNIWFTSLQNDYFAAGSGANPVLHTWSLAVEEQFYLAWPVVLYLVVRFAGTWKRIVSLLAIATVAFFALSYHRTTSNPTWAFFASLSRAWEFALGGMAAFLTAHALPRISRAAANVLSALGLIGLIASLIIINPATRFPGWAAALPVVSTVLLLLIGGIRELHDIPSYRLLSTPPLPFIGRLSYSLYLWHWPVLVFADWFTDDFTVGLRLACIALSFVLASGSLYLVENPIRFSKWLVRRPGFSVGLALSLTLASAGLSYLALRRGLSERASPAQRPFVLALRDRARVYADKCVQGLGRAALIQCTYADSASDSSIVLIGDSHAVQWFPAVEQIARERHLKLVTMLKVSCPFADVPTFDISSRGEEPQCAEWRAKAFAAVEKLHPRMVVGAQYEGYVFPLPDERVVPVTIAKWGDGLRRSITAFDTAGIAVTLMRDTPHMRKQVPECLSQHVARPRLQAPSCDTRRSLALSDSVLTVARDAASHATHARVVDLSDKFCTNELCTARRDGYIVYFDNGHVTASYVTHIAGVLRERLGLTVTGGE